MSVFYPECRINVSAVFDGFGGPDSPIVLPDVIPYTANVHLNSYKEADSWEVEFDAKKFPFSPELLRSAAVEIYLFNKTGLVSPQKWYDQNNLLVTGLVDHATLSEDEGGGRVVFQGRDYTALMLDKQWDPLKSGKGGRIPDGPLDAVVQQLVDEATLAKLTGRTLTVKLFDEGDKVSVSSVSATITHRVQKIPRTTTHRSRKPRGITVKADSTYWDVIYKLCLAYGFVVFVRGFEVWITPPHVLQEAAATQYRVAYGRNLERLSVERRLSKEATPQIRVRSYDPFSKTVIEGVFPSENDIEAQKKGKDKKGKGGGFLTGVGVKREEFKVYTVPDVKDAAILRRIAKSTYYTLARGEGKIKFSTSSLADSDAQDLLKLRSADSVGIEWDAFNSEILANPSVSRQQKVRVLLSQGYSTEVAELVADQYSKLDYFKRPFYVKDVNFTWDSDQGVNIDVEAMGFINPDSPQFQ